MGQGNEHLSLFYGSFSNHEARRDRKLLLTKRELRRLEEDSKQPGFTIVPTLIFIDNHGRAKVDIALCKGKKEYDKRQTLKERKTEERWIEQSSTFRQ